MRRLLRFRLRSLLLLLLGISICLGLYVRSVEAQKESIAAVKRLGGWVYYDYQIVGDWHDPKAESWVPRWLLSPLGEDYFHDVTWVNMVGNEDRGKYRKNKNLRDEVIQHLDGFPDLQALALQKTQATDESLSRIGHLKRLRMLFVFNASDVSDDGVRHLGKLTKLELLHLEDAAVTDDSLAILSKLPKLERLTLPGNRFTDHGLNHLRNMKQLTLLWVGGSKRLGGNQITDEGLAALRGLSNLEGLELQRTLVTNDGLEHLKVLTNLKYVHLSGSRVTDANAIQGSLPNCRFHLGQ